MKISLFNSKTDVVPVEVERGWPEIVSKARRPPIRKEKDGALWSPAIFSPAQRQLKNVQQVCALVMDFDHEAEFQRELQPWRAQSFVAHTTFSHTPAAHRFRVIVPLKESIPAADFPQLWKWASSVSKGKIDAAASDASRMYYVPGRRSENDEYLFEANEGEILDWRKLNLPTLGQPLTRAVISENGHAKKVDELIRAAARASNGQETIALLGGDTSAFGGDESRADLALANRLAFYSGPDSSLLELMMRRSRLERPKWHEKHYGDGRTYLQGVIDKALSNRAEFYSNGNGRKQVTQLRIDKEEEWEPPAAFYQYDLPEFPFSELPEVIQPFVRGLARETQTALDLTAVLAIAVSAGAIGGHVRVQARKGWDEPTNIYALVVLGPGNRKSAAFSEVCEPLEEVERDLVAAKRDEIARAASEYRMLESRKEKLEKQAAQTDNFEERRSKAAEAIAVAQQLASAIVPVTPRLIVSDVTVETLATLLTAHEGRMCLLSAEGDLFDSVAGRYSNGTPNFDVILKGHCGDTLRVDRRGRSEYVQHPALTIGLTVQPDVIRGLVERPSFRARGLLGRFLYSLPPSTIGRRQIAPEPLSDQDRQSFRRTVKALAQIEPLTDHNARPVPRMLYLTADANNLLKEFERELEPKLADDSELGTMADWAGKLSGAVLRLAAILWLIDNAEKLTPWPDKISVETMNSAIEIGRYLTGHARAAFAEMGADEQLENAKRLLRWIERTETPKFTRREAHQAHRARFKTVDEIDPALDLLESHNYIRPQIDRNQERRPGRKASQAYDVNPFVFAAVKTDTNTAEQGECEEEAIPSFDETMPDDLTIPASVPKTAEAIDACIDEQRRKRAV
ncbi:MAG: DUF3987 domain-containing protein [Pyrinomonadaceae bacterium]